MSHGIPILSVVSMEGVFHQALVLRATSYRVYTMTDLTRTLYAPAFLTRQGLVKGSCFFLCVLWS